MFALAAQQLFLGRRREVFGGLSTSGSSGATVVGAIGSADRLGVVEPSGTTCSPAGNPQINGYTLGPHVVPYCKSYGRVSCPSGAGLSPEQQSRLSKPPLTSEHGHDTPFYDTMPLITTHNFKSAQKKQDVQVQIFATRRLIIDPVDRY
ncbi:hypothetical protein J6590_050655 [Homalodisca vitripennis]|nr:hypothetical protein J6590_050655 [Homalodisca vitripennis]